MFKQESDKHSLADILEQQRNRNLPDEERDENMHESRASVRQRFNNSGYVGGNGEWAPRGRVRFI